MDQIVVTVRAYAAADPEKAADQVADSEEIYEGFSHTYAASSLAELPHPSQVAAISEHFGS